MAIHHFSKCCCLSDKKEFFLGKKTSAWRLALDLKRECISVETHLFGGYYKLVRRLYMPQNLHKSKGNANTSGGVFNGVLDIC